MRRKKGFTLVELMVVVAIIAILAAVALPMYSQYRQKARLSTVIRSASGLLPALQSHFNDFGVFTVASVDVNGGAINMAGTSLAATLPRIELVEWSVAAPSSSLFQVQWHFTSRCPPDLCDGYWELLCDSETDKCTVRIKLDDDNTMGMNRP